MLTGKITRQCPIPHEEGEWFRIRKLSGKQLEEASDRQQAKYMAMVKGLGVDGFQALRSEAGEVEATDTPRDPAASYEVDTVLRYGVIEWSYQERLSPKQLDDLDDVTRVWAAREILDLTLPKPEESGNDSGRSTDR